MPAKYKISHLSSLLQDLQSILTQKKHLIVFNSEISVFPKYFSPISIANSKKMLTFDYDDDDYGYYYCIEREVERFEVDAKVSLLIQF